MTVTSDDLAVSLNTSSINVDRAEAMITDAVVLCLTIVDPLPDAADVVVKRVAIRGYLQPSAREYQMAASDPTLIPASPAGGVYLTRTDIADLRRMVGGGGAFSVPMLPATFVLTPSGGDLAAAWDDSTWGAW